MRCKLFIVLLVVTISNATFTPAGLLAYLNSIAGNYTISGQFQMSGPSDNVAPDGGVPGIYNNTGKWLGLVGGDYYWYGETTFSGYHDFNQYAIDYWNKSGLITICFSMPNPTTAGDLKDTSALDVNGLLGNSSTNTNFTTILTNIATGLLQLQNAGVVVFVRPFHEMNGNWFWWGTTHLSSAQFISMWQYTHNFFTNKGLKNLLYVWAPNAQITAFDNTYYPGSAYVDIVGMDLYSSTPSNYTAAYTSLLAFGKPVVLAEFGSNKVGGGGGDSNFSELTLISTLQNYMPKVVFWQQWWGANGKNTGWGMAECLNVSSALRQHRVLNRGDINFFNPPTPAPTHAPTPAPTLGPSPAPSSSSASSSSASSSSASSSSATSSSTSPPTSYSPTPAPSSATSSLELFSIATVLVILFLYL